MSVLKKIIFTKYHNINENSNHLYYKIFIIILKITGIGIKIYVHLIKNKNIVIAKCTVMSCCCDLIISMKIKYL